MDENIISGRYVFVLFQLNVMKTDWDTMGSSPVFRYDATDSEVITTTTSLRPTSSSDSSTVTSGKPCGKAILPLSLKYPAESSLVPSITNSPTSEANGGKGSGGLNAGELAGTIVGVIGGVLLCLGALFFWFRRRKAKGARPESEEQAPRSQVAASDWNERVELSATSTKSPIETPKPTELPDESRTTELPATEQARYFELPPETIKYELDSEHRPSKEPQELPASPSNPSMEPTIAPAEQMISPISPVKSDHELETAMIPNFQHEQPASSSRTDFISFAPEPSNEALLMDQYAQLEARRQRLLELDRIEKEQVELQSRIKEMAARKREGE